MYWPECEQTGLLISVKDLNETKMVCCEKIDVLDIKEPRNGSLGQVDPQTLAEILEFQNLPPVVSCALGELNEHSVSELTQYLDRADPNRRLNLVKVGLAALSENSEWKAKWLRLKDALPPPSDLVAVAYADYLRCDAPSIDQILEFASDYNVSTLLIDTFFKDGTHLLDHLSEDLLVRIRRTTKANNIYLCLAGSIRSASLKPVLRFNPDLVGVRGAVCTEQKRTSCICKNALNHFLMTLTLSHNQ